MYKKIFYFLLLVFALFIFGCSNEAKDKIEELEKDAVATEIKEQEEVNKTENNVDPIVETEKNEETQKCEEITCPTPKNGSLYVNYVLNNGSRDILEKVNDPLDYEILEISYEGHRLLGWYLDEELTNRFMNSDLNLPTDENDVIINVYAKWKVQTFLVTFMNGDDALDFQTVNYGEAAVPPTPPKVKYQEFVGWSCDFSCVKSELTVQAATTITGKILQTYEKIMQIQI